MDPPLLATVVTFRSLCERITDAFDFLPEQLVRSSKQLVLVDTKRVFLGPGIFQGCIDDLYNS